MVIEDLEKLTNQEKIEIFNASIKISKDNNLNILSSFGLVLNQVMKNKEKQNTNQDVVNENNTELEEVNEFEENYDEDTLKNVLKELEDERFLLIEKANNNINEYQKNKGHLTNLITYAVHASNGEIVSPELFLNNNNSKNGEYDDLRQEACNGIVELNDKARELLYLSLKYRNKDDLEVMRQRTIAKYDNLIKMCEENKDNFIVDSTNIHFSDLVLTTRNNGYARSGGNSDVAFDELYNTAISYGSITPNNTNNVGSKQLYNEMMTLIIERKNQLDCMSSEDFRNYKISLMSLSKEEIEKFEQDIKNRVKDEENNLTK